MMSGVENADNYEYKPDPLALPELERISLNDDADTRGKEVDLEKQILMIILKTPLLILKGFVELTDPAIIIAKAILDIAYAIQAAVIGVIEAALKAVKQGIQSAIDEAKGAMTEIEVNAATVGAVITATRDALIPTWEQAYNAVPDIDGGAAEQYDFEAGIVVSADDEDITKWEFKINSEELPDELRESEEFQQMKEQIEAAAALIEDYTTAKQSLVDLEQQMIDVTTEMEEKVTQAKEVMRQIFSSPYLLPSVWVALMPSQIPYFGGIVPFPFFVGPPSTIPGMIYLALLFIDAYEEKMHDQSEQLGNNEVNCQDEL